MTESPPSCPLDGAPLKSVHRRIDKPTVYEHQDGTTHPDLLPTLPAQAHHHIGR